MIIAYQNHRRVKDMVASERPQERLESLGVEALSDRELLAMIYAQAQGLSTCLAFQKICYTKQAVSLICFAGRQKTSVESMVLARLRYSS